VDAERWANNDHFLGETRKAETVDLSRGAHKVLRKTASAQAHLADVLEDLTDRMVRLEPLAAVLKQTAFESYATETEVQQAITVALATLALVDLCIEDFTGKTEPVKRKRTKKVGKHVN
jgi:hypothetical protein